MNALLWALVIGSSGHYTPMATFANQLDCEANAAAVYTYTKSLPNASPTIYASCVPVLSGGTFVRGK